MGAEKTLITAVIPFSRNNLSERQYIFPTNKPGSISEMEGSVWGDSEVCNLYDLECLSEVFCLCCSMGRVVASFDKR